jgi:hypothetical protein
MINRFVRRTLAVLASTAVLSFGVTAVADAAPTVSYPAGCYGFSTSWGATCFKPSGDDQYVRDLDANGRTVIVHLETTYGKTRDCAALPAADGWGVCKYDHREGECVRFYLYEENFGRESGWSRWYSTIDDRECLVITP